ncbi:MAG: efflux RND transporter permease subunit [Bacteroidota bacterium]
MQRFSATPAAGVSLGEAISEMDKVAKSVLPQASVLIWGGQSRDYSESSSSLVFAFVFAIILIYLVLAAQFESLIDPFIILLTVPWRYRCIVKSLDHGPIDQCL